VLDSAAVFSNRGAVPIAFPLSLRPLHHWMICGQKLLTAKDAKEVAKHAKKINRHYYLVARSFDRLMHACKIEK
jgi:hypothetical protein